MCHSSLSSLPPHWPAGCDPWPLKHSRTICRASLEEEEEISVAFSVMSERKTWFQSLTIVGGNHPISGHQPSFDFVLQCSLFFGAGVPQLSWWLRFHCRCSDAQLQRAMSNICTSCRNHVTCSPWAAPCCRGLVLVAGWNPQMNLLLIWSSPGLRGTVSRAHPTFLTLHLLFLSSGRVLNLCLYKVLYIQMFIIPSKLRCNQTEEYLLE